MLRDDRSADDCVSALVARALLLAELELAQPGWRTRCPDSDTEAPALRRMPLADEE
jgi:hypothetical protein